MSQSAQQFPNYWLTKEACLELFYTLYVVLSQFFWPLICVSMKIKFLFIWNIEIHLKNCLNVFCLINEAVHLQRWQHKIDLFVPSDLVQSVKSVVRSIYSFDLYFVLSIYSLNLHICSIYLCVDLFTRSVSLFVCLSVQYLDDLRHCFLWPSTFNTHFISFLGSSFQLNFRLTYIYIERVLIDKNIVPVDNLGQNKHRVVLVLMEKINIHRSYRWQAKYIIMFFFKKHDLFGCLFFKPQSGFILKTKVFDLS